MGQVIFTLGLCNALLGQLYCKKSSSIQEIAKHYQSSRCHLYFKDDVDIDENADKEEEEYTPDFMLFELLTCYTSPDYLISHLDKDDFAPRKKNWRPFIRECSKRPGPIITARHFDSQAQQERWDQLNDPEQDGDVLDDSFFKVFFQIPLSFAPGWRTKISLIPRVCTWRPDEIWLADKNYQM
jgi:hypothetical protein